MARILFPLPDHDFDVTEVSVPWKYFSRETHEVVFATETGNKPQADPLLLKGVLFGKLGAEPEAKRFYRELEKSPEFSQPILWKDIEPEDYDALFLAGGHAPGMRQFLGSTLLQKKVAEFWSLSRPVAAICHGVLLLARAIDPNTGKSILEDRRTTCLPKYMERLAYFLSFWKLGRYYRTYPAYVEEEVRQALQNPREDFFRGPITLGTRGTADNHTPAFVLEDKNYLSARWPGDAYLLSVKFLMLLNEFSQKKQKTSGTKKFEN